MAAKTARPPAAPDLSIEYRRLDAIKHLPRNAKDHDVGAIVAAIREFGMIDPLAINEKTGHDFDGNGRLKALRAMMAENSSAPPRNVRIARDGMWMIPTVAGINLSPVDEARAGLALNRVHDLGGYDQGTLAEILSDLAADQALGATGYDANDVDALLRAMNDARNAGDQDGILHIKLAERFLIPPFSILDARQGYWQARKEAWLALGIQSEVGRGENLHGFSEVSNTVGGYAELAKRHNNANVIPSGRGTPTDRARDGEKNPFGKGSGDPRPLTYTGRPAEYQAGYRENGRGAAKTHTASLDNGALTVGTTTDPYRRGGKGVGRPRAITTQEWVQQKIEQGIIHDGAGAPSLSGTSIFDPVLCEIAYRWFCPPRATVLDPFAGGSVRGIVAGWLGHAYTGIDLRAEQVAANEVQAKQIKPKRRPKWITGDARDLKKLVKGAFDFFFSCPPYFDLERYSDDPSDLSNAGDYGAFIEAYRAIIANAVARLRPNRFAMFVVGDIRDKQGFYRNFVSDTIAAFEAAGAMLYNEAILVTAIGSLPIRIGRQFGQNRKVGKTHQNVLVFYKGDPKQIAPEFGMIEIPTELYASDQAAPDET